MQVFPSGSQSNAPRVLDSRLGAVVACLRLARACLGTAADQFAGGVHKLAKASIRPGIEIVPGVDWELAGLAEGRAGSDAGVLCKGGLRARDAVVFANVASRFCPPHIQRRLRFHIRTPAIVLDRWSIRAYPVPVIWKGLGRLTPGSGSVFSLT